MEREFPLLLIFVFFVAAGLACTFARRLVGGRVTEETLSRLLARGRLGAHAMAMFVAVQGMRAFAEADPRALTQGVEAGMAIDSLRAGLGFALDDLGAHHLVALTVVATLDGIVTASLARGHRLVEAGRRSLLFGLAGAAIMAESLPGMVIAWMAMAPLLLVDTRRRRDRVRASERGEPERLVALEGIGVAAGVLAILTAQATVGSLRWDALARGAFAELQVPIAAGLTPASLLWLAFGGMVVPRILGVSRRRSGPSALAVGTTVGLGGAYLVHRCAWLVGIPSRERIDALVVVALATALALAWAIVRDEPEALPGGRVAVRLQRAVVGAGERGLAPLRVIFAAPAHAARGFDHLLLELGPGIAREFSRQLRRDLEGLARRAGVDLPGVPRSTLAFVGGVVLVLGSLYFKPAAVTPLWDEVHRFGGLRARLYSTPRARPVETEEGAIP